MFTGIVTHTGRIASAEQRGDLRITVASDLKDVRAGESVCVSGACLTALEDSKDGTLTFDLSAETLACTVPGMWKKGIRVNLERALALGDLLSGHLVTGHIDGTATVKTTQPSGDSRVLILQAPAALSRYIAAKGSVTLDGVSLTVNQVEGQVFSVNVVPHTLAATTLSDCKSGNALNLEIDLVARYVERLLGK